jgi:SAM-dependent methyltransferase
LDQRIAKAATYWSTARSTGRTRWWTHPVILRHINRLVCGQPVDGPWEGLERRMRALSQEEAFRRGISVGCGNALKEVRLLKKGIVRAFDVFEISPARVDQGRRLAEQQGVSDRIRFSLENAFDQNLGNDYDLVYWNNALHHMFDVREALAWSRDRLVVGGYLVMDDFVGPSRFQWTNEQLAVASAVRALLPDRFMVDPRDPSRRLPRQIRRPSIDAMVAADPTEAADSSNILPALQALFPKNETILTGGVIYHSALNDVLANFDDTVDATLLESLLLLDKTLTDRGDTQYAVAFAPKG